MSGEFNSVGAGYALDVVTGRAAGPGARTTYLALCTSAPVDGDTLTQIAAKEVTTAGYARQSVTWSAPSGDPRSSNNTNVLTFGPFTAASPSVTHAALVSAVSGTSGDVVAFWGWDTARTAASGDSLQVAVGALVLTCD